MVIDKDITELESSIVGDQAKELILLLLSGTEKSAAGQVHSFLGGMGLEPHRKYFLITNLDLLAQQQRDDWFGGVNANCYAVLKRTTKEVACTGPVSELMAGAQPSAVKIRLAFTKGGGHSR